MRMNRWEGEARYWVIIMLCTGDVDPKLKEGKGIDEVGIGEEAQTLAVDDCS
jgi:hypothetical protein